MYNLKIYNGTEWIDADLKQDLSIAATFEEAGIAEMSLKGNGTVSVSLPVTPTNARIFGQAQELQVFAQQTRKHLPCRLFADGLEIFGSGSYCVLLSTTATEYSVSVLGGSCDVFTALQNVVFEDYPDALGTTHRYSLNYYPEVDEMGSRKMGRVWHSSLQAIRAPFIRQMLEDATGYTLPTNVFREGYYIGLVSHKRKNDAEKVEAFDALTKGKGTYRYDSTTPVEDSELYSVGGITEAITRIGLRVRIIGKYTTTSYSSQVFKFGLKVNGTMYTMVYSFSGTMQANGFKKGSYADEEAGSIKQCYYRDLYFMNDGTIKDGDGATVSGTALNIATLPESISNLKWGYWDWTVTHIVKDDEYEFSPNYPSSCIHCEFQPLIAYTDESAAYYSEMSIGANIGFKNGLELYKALAQTFGLITHTDGDSVAAYSMSDVIGAKSAAIDWTDKIVDASHTFTADGYGRTTHYAFTEDTDNAISVEKTIESDDENLTESVTNTIAFLAGNSPAPGFCLKDAEGNWRELSAPYLSKWNTQHSALYCATADEFAEYDTIEQLLASWLKVEATAVLTPVDIITLDHRKPIYLQQYGAYFYVEKVSNWIDKKTCTIELLRL